MDQIAKDIWDWCQKEMDCTCSIAEFCTRDGDTDVTLGWDNMVVCHTDFRLEDDFEVSEIRHRTFWYNNMRKVRFYEDRIEFNHDGSGFILYGDHGLVMR